MRCLVSCRFLTRSQLFSTLLPGLLLGCSSGGYHQGALDPDDLGSRPDGQVADMRPVGDLARPTMRNVVTFAPPVTYATGTSAFTLAVGRINSDTAPDLIASAGTETYAYQNRGEGMFDIKHAAIGPRSSWQITAEDLNGDGLADLALTDPSTGKITVAMGKGDSTFASATSYPVGRAPQSVVAVDLNRDGFRDLVAGSYSDNRLDVLINNGNGTFRTSGTYATLLNPIWLATADLNHDSKPDVIASQYDAKAGVSVFLGNGDGTLKSGQLIAVAPSTVGVATGDLDFDGDLDVVVVQESNQVQIYLNKGDATFTTGTPLMLGAGSGQGVQVADLNADNIPDVVAVCAGSGFARVFLGLGNGTFLPEVTFASGATSPFNVVAADWNGDGLTDLALSESSAQKISILMNTTKR